MAPVRYLCKSVSRAARGRRLGELNKVGRVTPCAPSCPALCRRARSDAPYPPPLMPYSLLYLKLPPQKFGDGFGSGADLELFVDAANIGVNGLVTDAQFFR